MLGDAMPDPVADLVIRRTTVQRSGAQHIRTVDPVGAAGRGDALLTGDPLCTAGGLAIRAVPPARNRGAHAAGDSDLDHLTSSGY